MMLLWMAILEYEDDLPLYLSTLIMTKVSTDTFTDKLEMKGQNWKYSSVKRKAC